MPTLGYWKTRGIVSNIIYQLKYQNVDFELVEYTLGDADTGYSNKEWADVKFTLGLPFPNLPYFIDGDVKITEFLAIHKYVADKWNPELLGRDPVERANVEMLCGIVSDLKWAFSRPCYSSPDVAPIVEIIRARLPPIVSFMGPNNFLAGNEVTWIDFLFYECTEMMRALHPDLYLEFPSLETHHANVASLPHLKEYLADPNHRDAQLKFNNKVALILN